jgi:uncharacterized membrane protein
MNRINLVLLSCFRSFRSYITPGQFILYKVFMGDNPGDTTSDIFDRLGLDKASMMAFSDGIFAIAITLLVLELRIPEIPSHDIDTLFLPTLVDIFPKILGFILSFFIIANFWLSYRRMFSFIPTLDRVLVRLHIVFLFFIVLMPFPTYLLGIYGNHLSVVVFYALILTMSSLLLFFLWKYASKNHRLIEPDLSEHFIEYMSVRNLITPVTFLVSIPIALVNPLLAMVSWSSMLVTFPFVKARYKKKFSGAKNTF